MKKLFLILLSLFILSACASPNNPIPSAATLPSERADDFKVSYTWSAGSVEEVYHYTYTITLSSQEKGEIVYKAGYQKEWAESFILDETALDTLYAELHALNAFTEEWQQMEDLPDGGSTSSSVLVAYGQKNVIPSYVGGEKSGQIYAIYDHIESLVPQDIWQMLEGERDNFIEENGG